MLRLLQRWGYIDQQPGEQSMAGTAFFDEHSVEAKQQQTFDAVQAHDSIFADGMNDSMPNAV